MPVIAEKKERVNEDVDVDSVFTDYPTGWCAASATVEYLYRRRRLRAKTF
jgi:hypothetical protein